MLMHMGTCGFDTCTCDAGTHHLVLELAIRAPLVQNRIDRVLRLLLAKPQPHLPLSVGVR